MVAGRPRGRTGRGWDASPSSASSARSFGSDAVPVAGAHGTGEHRTGAPRAGEHRAVEDAKPVDQAERAREICLRQLAVRPRTRAELAGALRQRGVPDEVAAEVLDRYGEVGIIDDQAFARAWVSSRHHGRGLAKKALAGELRRKGVDDDAMASALDELDDDTESETARALVERKLRSDRGTDPAATARRLVGMLARKGYSAGLAFRVVRQAMADRSATRQDDLDQELTDSAADDLETSVLGTLDQEPDGPDGEFAEASGTG